jgi:hypothetical protein
MRRIQRCVGDVLVTWMARVKCVGTRKKIRKAVFIVRAPQ